MEKRKTFHGRQVGKKRLLPIVFPLFLFLLIPLNGYGDDTPMPEVVQQNSTRITGVVKDAYGEPVIGANVKVVGTTQGTITDFEGKFSINVSGASAKIKISFIGYKDKEVTAKKGVSLNIVLEEDAQTLGEVQVVAYGVQKKVSITGAISSMKGDDLLKTPAGSLSNVLSGQITGISSVQYSGEPGADAAEAKVIVASRYFDLFRHFGGLPLIKETYDVQPSYELPRATVEETVNYMINLLDEAAATPQLPWDLGTDDTNWQGRFTKAAAMGLKCKILLFAASPLFNDNVPYCTEPPQDAVTNHQVWYGAYKPELWDQCLQACVDFFTELQSRGYYELTQATEATAKGYRDAYNKAYFTRENNKELLISTHISRFGKFNSWDEWQYIFVNSGNGTVITGGLTPTLEFMEMFPMSNGEPFQLNTATDLFYTDNDYNKPIRDPRLYETMLVNGTQFGDHAAELWIGGRDNINDTEKETGKYATGFGCYKFYKEGVNSLKDKYLQWPYLRLAEMYLIYAEALLKSKNDLPGAIEQVNKVRARVGLGDLAVCNPGKNLTTDADALLEEILRERACELGLEDVRLFDMTRYKREDLFRKQLHGLKIYRNDGGGNTPWSGSTGNSSIYPKPTKFTHEAFPLVNPSRAWWSNFSPKWYLSAFPPSEVNKKYGLTQNPGWN